MTADSQDTAARAWRAEAVRRIEADYNRSADTHLIRIDLPRHPGIKLSLKDESSHPTGCPVRAGSGAAYCGRTGRSARPHDRASGTKEICRLTPPGQ